jgi:hypothetical protein
MEGAQTACTQLGIATKQFSSFWAIQEMLKGCMFMLDDAVWDAVVEWFRQQYKEFFADWIN